MTPGVAIRRATALATLLRQARSGPFWPRVGSGSMAMSWWRGGWEVSLAGEITGADAWWPERAARGSTQEPEAHSFAGAQRAPARFCFSATAAAMKSRNSG